MTGSVRELLSEATGLLASAAVDSPRADAELLLAHCLGARRSQLRRDAAVDPERAKCFLELVARRARREPLQHLLGSTPFRFTSVAVGPGVFIPRPETELLVDAELAALAGLDAPVVVDLCAGSGALALSIAQELPRAQVIAVERSPQAIAWLHRNAAGTAVEVVEADVREPGLLARHLGRVDAVLSNPPYVPLSTVVGPEVAHDPPDAVFAGADGLAVIPDVITVAARLLRPGGTFALEHDESHGQTVPALLRASGHWTDVLDHLDLTGRPRYATAVRARPEKA